MATVTAHTLASNPSMRRTLTQQGVGGRAKALRNRMIRRVLSLLLLGLSLSIVQVWSRMQVLQVRYAMTGLQKRVEDLRQDMNRRTMAITALKAPDRLERVAREVLGLQVPVSGQLIFVREATDGEHRIADQERIGGATTTGQ